VLSISPPLTGAGQGDYYLELAREDYYTKGGEPPGHWHGKGAKALGQKGQVTPDDLRSYLDGYSPDSKAALVQNAGKEDRQAGWDLTFSAPKSVSVLWSQASPEIRKEIQAAQQEAVNKALSYLESEAGITRRGKGGGDKEQAGLVFATFEHGTSRAQDQQLHTHALLLNIGVREDGTTGSIESRGIFRHKMAAGAVYRAELSHQLETRLGLLSEKKKNWFELKGVSPELIDETSKRRKEVQAELSKSGYSGAKASKVATLNSRTVKEHVAREELFAKWQEAGRQFGFSEAEVNKLLGQKINRNIEGEKAQAFELSLNKVTARESHFTKRDLVRSMAEEAQGRGFGAKDIFSTTDKYLKDSPEIVRLGVFDGQERFSTKEIVELEKKTLLIVKSRKDENLTVRESSVNASIAKRKNLSEEQTNAIRHITQKSGGVQIVSGMAGTGKSYMLEAARDAYENDGFTVIGAAPSGIAAKGLENSTGIKSTTIHKRLADLGRGDLALNERTVLIIDEAGMVGTRQMAKLVNEANSSKTKLILVGDEKQLQSVDAGGAFSAFSKELGRSELKTIRRQNDAWAREAVSDFAHGESKKALAEYAKRGLVTVSATPTEARDALISDWKKDGAANPDKNLILVGTNLDAKILNERAQALRYSGEHTAQIGLEANGYSFHAGDRILFTKNSSKYGVQNGSLGNVTEINAKTRSISAKLDDGRSVKIDLSKYEDIKLGYAVTTHKSQGSTFEKTYVLAGGPMQDRELSYVQASRAKGETRFYMDEQQAGKNLTEISRAMSKSHQKSFATALIKDKEPSVLVKGMILER